MARTLQQQLDDLDAAIARIENGGQRSTSEGGDIEYGNYADLVAERARVSLQLSRSLTGGITHRRW